MAGEPTFGLFTNGNKMMHREGAKSTVHFLCVLSLSGPHVLVQDPPLEQLLVHISHVLLHRFSDAHLPLLLYPAFKRLSPLFHSSWCPPGITLLVKLIKNNGFGSAFKLEERVICHKFSGEHALAQGPLGKVLSYLPQHWPTWFAPRLIEFEPRAVGPFPASFSLTHAGDVLLLPTSGHTPHHFSVLVQDGSISYFLAGDASYMERFMTEQIVDAVSPNVQIARQTLARIYTYAQGTPLVYLPSHDPEAIQRLSTQRTVAYTEQTEREGNSRE